MKCTSVTGLALLGLAEAYPSILAQTKQLAAADKRDTLPTFVYEEVPFDAAAVGRPPNAVKTTH